MAKSKTKRKTRRKSGAVTELPKGYTAISGGGRSWPNDDTKPGTMIEGTVIEFDSVEQQRKRKGKIITEEVQIARFECKDGSMYTLWESVMLRPLFEYEDGVEAAVIFDGYGEAKRGQNAPKLFRIGIVE